MSTAELGIVISLAAAMAIGIYQGRSTAKGFLSALVGGGIAAIPAALLQMASKPNYYSGRRVDPMLAENATAETFGYSLGIGVVCALIVALARSFSRSRQA